VAIRGDRIVAVGTTHDLAGRFSGRDVIDASRKIIMRGLIDGHGHAGPHMVPMNMPLYRVAYFANGNDVNTTIVNGRVLMRDRKVLSVNEDDVLTLAQREADAAIRRTGLESMTQTPEGFWGRSRWPKK
jgi:cytosine/adenosine deaminase-related metal-dependent hydrolase